MQIILRPIRGEHDAVETQQFGSGPSLKRTTARCVRRFRVGNFRNMAEAGVL